MPTAAAESHQDQQVNVAESSTPSVVGDILADTPEGRPVLHHLARVASLEVIEYEDRPGPSHKSRKGKKRAMSPFHPPCKPDESGPSRQRPWNDEVTSPSIGLRSIARGACRKRKKRPHHCRSHADPMTGTGLSRMSSLPIRHLPPRQSRLKNLQYPQISIQTEDRCLLMWQQMKA